jgi:hypothetical protein
MSALREYVKMKYVGDCKCGDCQLVPTKVLYEQDANIEKLVQALTEAERFMSYFAGETRGSFVGPGTPKSCLKQIRAALS